MPVDEVESLFKSDSDAASGPWHTRSTRLLSAAIVAKEWGLTPFAFGQLPWKERALMEAVMVVVDRQQKHQMDAMREANQDPTEPAFKDPRLRAMAAKHTQWEQQVEAMNKRLHAASR